MTDLQAMADRVEITALQAEYTDAAMMKDRERLVSLFTDDGVYRIPDVDIEYTGREELQAGLQRDGDAWEFFIQTTHPGALHVDGDTATGRAYIFELGRQRDGRSMLNHSLFHDSYRRTAAGWRFTERSFEIRYFDTTPLAGSPEVVWTGAIPSEDESGATQER